MATITQQIINQLKEALEVDLVASPMFIFVTKLKDELQSRGFDIPTSEELATSIDVEISEGAASVEELVELAKLYAQLIEKSWAQFHLNGFNDPTQAMRHMSKKMTLKLPG